ncbi:lipocalin family protein [Aquimarina aquimarini]|uniref:lipocalin family protein n=1 Tax=Aquimarina aquimarini TaxID=1191734 RepID=UPI000D54E499|nr:lipocalin family protein [Aquimarina aquimarini]
MKKVILVATVFLSALSISCSSDDDSAGQDPLIGEWNLIARADIVDGKPVADDLGCELKEPLTFKADGTFSSIDFDQDQDGNCFEERTINGTWKNLESGKYSIDKETIEIIFEGNTFIITYTNIDGTTKETYQRK